MSLNLDGKSEMLLNILHHAIVFIFCENLAQSGSSVAEFVIQGRG